MSETFEHVFPAIRGKQAGRELFVSLCPLSVAAKLFQFAEESVPEPVRRTRILNQESVAQIAKYLSSNPDAYVLPSLLVSVDGKVRFNPVEANGDLGHLHIPMAARLVVNAGEHERAAIEKAVLQAPALGNEKISVVFHPDKKLKRAERIYADLKMFATRASASLRLLHSAEDDTACLCRELINQAKPFRDFVEVKRSALSPRSKMLFTLSAVYQATRALLADMMHEPYDARLRLTVKFWNTVDSQFPEWCLVRSEKIASSHARAEYLHSHALALQAIGRAGSALVKAHPNDWAERLKGLGKIDWRRANTREWEGRAFIAGKVSKATADVILTANVIKNALSLPLSVQETDLESAVKAGKSRR